MAQLCEAPAASAVTPLPGRHANGGYRYRWWCHCQVDPGHCNPSTDPTGRGQAAGVIAASTERAAAAQPRHGSRNSASGGRAVAQLTKTIISPAHGCPNGGQRAAVESSHRDCDAAASEARHGNRVVSAPRSCRRDFSGTVVAPARDRASGGQSAGVKFSRRDRRNSRYRRPDTATGISLSVVVPLPSWPLALSPQHMTAPAVVRAQA